MAASTQAKTTATTSSSADAKFTVFLHPLVIMNISDHFTRSSVHVHTTAILEYIY